MGLLQFPGDRKKINAIEHAVWRWWSHNRLGVCVHRPISQYDLQDGRQVGAATFSREMETTMTNNVKSKAGKQWRIILFLAMAVLGGVAGYFVYQAVHRDPGGEGPDMAGGDATPELTSDEALAAIELKDTSVGHLENGPAGVEGDEGTTSGLELAAEGFEQLAQLLPGESLPLRNLAITHLLILRSEKDDIPQARKAARNVAARFLEAEPDSALAHYLSALIELHPDPGNPLGITDEIRADAVAMLQQAAELDSDNAVFWYAIKDAAQTRGAAAPSEQVQEALKRAYSLRPRNIFLLTEMLVMQASIQDPEIKQTLEAAKDVFRPLAAGLQQRRRMDIQERIDTAIKAVDDGDWRNVLVGARIINNIVRPEEVAKSDIDRVNVHPLEFVMYEFSDSFYEQYVRPQPKIEPSTSVRLVKQADESLARLSDVRQVCLMDFDVNGLPDILVLQPGRLSVWGRETLDDAWAEIASLDMPEGMMGMVAADLDRDRQKTRSAPAGGDPADDAEVRFDNVISGTEVCHDADPDIIVYGKQGVRVVRTDLGGSEGAAPLVIVENEAMQSLADVETGLLLDLDHDGDLDFVCSSTSGVSLWQAGEKLAFTDTSEFSQLPPSDVPLTTMVAVDWDRDADIDVVVGEPSGRITGLLENMRHGQFQWSPFPDEYEQLGKPQAIGLLEADGNVSWDLLTAGQQGVRLVLTATPRTGTVNFLKSTTVSEQPAAGLVTADFDNDGFRDAALWGPQQLSVWRGGPGGSFSESSILSQPWDDEVHSAASIDLDRDGDQDLVVAGASGISVLQNEGGSEGGWITLYPLGQMDNKGRCNHHAIGSLVEMRSGGWYQAQVVDGATVHFGLGTQDVAQQMRVVWTNGVPQDLVDQRGNVAICEPMALKGSCPYLYTLADGQFSFFTDCLWAAPIGMQTPAGTVAPTRSWEYLFVPGQRLSPHEGSYWIMMTEELWEAGYFDMVRLIAVDHPANVEVYSNEKVGPDTVAEPKIHTVSRRRLPVRATDQQGRDLLETLRARDGNYVKAFHQRIRQGLTPEHYIELDLGPLEDPQQITLFLTGWIWPTDTSLNIAFAQDPETDGPRMPSVLVPDADGQWRETIAYMGFPGGKTKTIAVDLSEAFLTSDYRVRIQTTAEIYWDEAFFSVDEPEVELRQTPLTLQSAEVAYRGFSSEIPRPDQAPQMYDASSVRRDPIWPPMRGNFTRYGPVTRLLQDGDDMLVVIGAGDALTVRFAVPDQDPPPGWKRDFLLHSIGYDKDADLNTIYGQTVEPLPYRGMSQYPAGPDEAVPDGEAFQRYLRRYQTRQQDPQAFWRRLVLPK
jgi:hypothetical protein